MATGKKRRAHPTYSLMMTAKPKHQGAARRGKNSGRRFAKRGPEPVGKGKVARFY